MHGHFRTDAAASLICLVSLAALAVGCRSGSATADAPASIAIVDLFSQDGVEVLTGEAVVMQMPLDPAEPSGNSP